MPLQDQSRKAVSRKLRILWAHLRCMLYCGWHMQCRFTGYDRDDRTIIIGACASDMQFLKVFYHEPNVCTGCGHEVDPELCWCGDEIKKHNPMWDGHNPVPLGCTCGYAKDKL